MDHELQRAKEIFELAIELDSEAREKLVTMACGDDQGLLDRVHGLLREHEKSGDLLDTNVTTARTRRAFRVVRSSIPERVAHYRVIEKLGSGGMGEARDHRVRLRKQSRSAGREFSSIERCRRLAPTRAV